MFKVGDKVRYTGTKRVDLTIGSVYVINAVKENYMTIIDDRNEENSIPQSHVSPTSYPPSVRHKHADVMIAYANDKTIQIEYKSHDVWKPVDDVPYFDDNTEYRIKPEPLKGWVNAYKSQGVIFVLSRPYATKEDALRNGETESENYLTTMEINIPQ